MKAAKERTDIKNSKKEINNKIYHIEEQKEYNISYIKNQNNIKKDYRNKIRIRIIKLILIMHLMFITKEKKYMQSQYSFITLKINNTGKNKIYYDGDDYNSGCSPGAPLPDEIFINNINQSKVQYYYNFNQSENIVKLIFHKPIDKSTCMFVKCSNITEVDLSNFDSSQLTRMNSMFTGCSSLKSIDFTNVNTSQVEWMGWMFNNCSSLVSLNLSNFDTSKVIWTFNMFHSCLSLETLDLNNFVTPKLTETYNMFKGCTALKSLDISNFNSLLITNMDNMFDDCPKLEYINLENTVFKNDFYNKIKELMTENIFLCSKDGNIKNKLNACDIFINCFNDYNILNNDEFKCYKKCSNGIY